MSKTAVISFRVDERTLAKIDQIAKSRGRSRAWFAAEATRRLAESEAEFLAFVQEGIDAADRGDLVPHEDAMAELSQMIERHRAR